MDKEKSSQQPNIEFQYMFEKSYNPTYVNGAYGGVNPQGEIIAHFYFERSAIPYSELHEIEQTVDGNVDMKQEVYEYQPNNYDKIFLRFVNSGIIMNLATAKRIYEWLGRHIQSLESKNSEAE